MTRPPVPLHHSILTGYPVVRDVPEPPPLPVVSASPLPGVRVVPLRWHVDARGGLVELHRESWAVLQERDGTVLQDAEAELDPGREHLAPARQVYLSATEPGTVKGWHLHLRQVDRFACLRGRVRLVLVDLRGYAPASGSDGPPFRRVDLRTLNLRVPAREVVLDATKAPVRVEVPPGVAHGWLALGSEEAWILNCVSREYDGTDERRCDPHGPVAPGLPVFDWRKLLDG